MSELKLRPPANNKIGEYFQGRVEMESALVAR